MKNRTFADAVCMKTLFFSFREYNLKILKRFKTYLLRGITMTVVLFFFIQNTDSQITAPQSDFQKTLGYLSATDPDPLFVFYRDEGDNDPASLNAASPEPGNSNFDWSKYNPSTAGWDPYASQTNLSSSTLTGLDEGGYEVRVTNGTGLDTTFRAWVMLDHLLVNVDKKEDGGTKRYNYSCDFLILSGEVVADTFYYYDPVTNDKIGINNGFTFVWTSDNSDNKIYNATSILSPNTSYDPPVKNTQYVLTAVDSLGMTVDDSVYYESINTKASFQVEYLDKLLDPPSFTENPQHTDAPLTVKFINESENGYEFEWVFVDTADITQKESLITTKIGDSPEFKYYRANKYYDPILISRSLDPLALEGCADTFRLESSIFVEASSLDIPNVFSPNGDSYNDYFTFSHQSIKECKVTIIDRYGKVVYRIKTDDIYSWEGWNGKIMNSDRDAPEGPYFYVIEAVGYDDEEYKDPNIIEQWKTNRQSSTSSTSTSSETTTSTNKYTGWVYLFRDSGQY